MVLVVICGLVALTFFLNPKSELFDMRVGGMIGLSIVIGFASGLQRWMNEADLKRTVSWGVLGAGLIGIITLVANVLWTAGQSFSVADSVILALPGIFEELLFRAGVYLTVLRVTGSPIAIFAASLTFATYHAWVANLLGADFVYFAVLFAGGIVLQVIFLITHNLLTSMIAHELNNLKPILFSMLVSPFGIAVIVLAIVLFVLMKR
jgi:membrane protease YdiL (CAAX protease family)